MTRCAALLLVLAAAMPASAQVTGHVSVMVDALPDPDAAVGRQPITETRARLFAEHRRDVGQHVRLVLSGHLDGLVHRQVDGGSSGRAVVARPLDLYGELVWPRVEVRAGASRLVWGRLDEFQPTDVVNPIDLSRFLLEGRSEARLPVGLVRTRFFLPSSTTVELVAVPAFRAGRFDQLGESASPFNLDVLPRALVERRQPSLGAASVQGGARVTSTAGRVDWGATVYRGLRAFPIGTSDVLPLSSPPASLSEPPAFRQTAPLPFGPPLFTETFPRFTMVGGDFETTRGPWGLRGELAVFLDDTLQSFQLGRGVEGTSIEAGAGLDRRAGSYRLAGNVLMSHRSPDHGDLLARSLRESSIAGTDWSLVVAADRSFARETRTLRLFTVHDPFNDTTFARVIGAASLRDDVWVEASGGLFAGSASSTIGRLTRKDFLYVRLKVYF